MVLAIVVVTYKYDGFVSIKGSSGTANTSPSRRGGQQLSWMSRAGSDDRIGEWSPRSLMLKHGVEDGQQLAHAGGECQLLGLACSQQTLVEGPNHWVEASSDQGSHVEGRPYRGASAPDGAFPPPGATIPVEGGYPHQGAELPAGQGPQFGQLRHEGGGEGGSTPGTLRSSSSRSRQRGLSPSIGPRSSSIS